MNGNAVKKILTGSLTQLKKILTGSLTQLKKILTGTLSKSEKILTRMQRQSENIDGIANTERTKFNGNAITIIEILTRTLISQSEKNLT